MTFHDQFCGHADGGACICTQLLAARIDERERQLAGVIDRSFIGRDFAEAIAARLVEVVCRQERTRQIHVAALHGLSVQGDVLEAERDAARAEVAALREELERAPDGWEIVVARKAVLADLRAEVAADRENLCPRPDRRCPMNGSAS